MDINAITSTKCEIDGIKSLLDDLGKSIEKLAVLVRGVAEKVGGYAEAIDHLHAEIPRIDVTFWRSICSVAQGRLHPLVLSTGCVGIKHLNKLPLAEQESAILRGVPVLVSGEDYRLIPAHKLSAMDIARAIDPSGHLRSIQEQQAADRATKEKWKRDREECLKKWKEIKAEEPDESSDVVQWKIMSGKIAIYRTPLHLTKKELITILESMGHKR